MAKARGFTALSDKLVGAKLPFNTEIKIDMETMQEDRGAYLGDRKAYYSLQAIEDEKEGDVLWQRMRERFFKWSRDLTLDQLRRIEAITEEVSEDG